MHTSNCSRSATRDRAARSITAAAAVWPDVLDRHLWRSCRLERARAEAARAEAEAGRAEAGSADPT